MVGGAAIKLVTALLMHLVAVPLAAAGIWDIAEMQHAHFLLNSPHPTLYTSLCDPEQSLLRRKFQIACFVSNNTPFNMWDNSPQNATSIIVMPELSFEQTYIMDITVRHAVRKASASVWLYRELTLQVAHIILESTKTQDGDENGGKDGLTDPASGEAHGTEDATGGVTPARGSAEYVSQMLVQRMKENVEKMMGDKSRLLKECVIAPKEMCRGHRNHITYLRDLFPNFLNASSRAASNFNAADGKTFPPRGDEELGAFGAANDDILIQYAKRFLVTQITMYTQDAKKTMEEALWLRECLLINEVNTLVYDMTEYSGELHRLIQELVVKIMNGYYHLVTIAIKMLDANLKAIRKLEPDEIWAQYAHSVSISQKFARDIKATLVEIMSAQHYKGLKDVFNRYALMTGRKRLITQPRRNSTTLLVLKTAAIRALKEEITVETAQRVFGIIGTREWFARLATEYRSVSAMISKK
ncbi:hypothetical protein, conserved [Babesia bigemina]|uniref:Uncharacterized protein n=1 Tax=Babesia bigemina TaxID=5866 RepID=A0A061D2A3_BABBI|nr:hypothetical protein, conserved [Babesia bigemina]CDR94738.1 hypothetical protein, conserved [Babesia bigemina]|eukprot:XP_012766924.1 hypothetical protein, conserved [Babesia bigemina]